MFLISVDLKYNVKFSSQEYIYSVCRIVFVICVDSSYSVCRNCVLHNYKFRLQNRIKFFGNIVRVCVESSLE